jgi:hypothetical protein
VQHAEEIVIGNDEQRGGVLEGLVVGEPGGFGVPVLS